MASSKYKRVCLSCKHFRPKDAAGGRCRLDKDKIEPSDYPFMNHGDCCDSWRDVGQKYYIRIGWIRGLANRTKDEPDVDSSGVG
jgi:hypothetical protein